MDMNYYSDWRIRKLKENNEAALICCKSYGSLRKTFVLVV